MSEEAKKKVSQFCSGWVPVFVHPSLYRVLKLTFPWDIGSLTIDGHIKNEMGQVSMGEAVSLLTPTIFKAGGQFY